MGQGKNAVFEGVFRPGIEVPNLASREPKSGTFAAGRVPERFPTSESREPRRPRPSKGFKQKVPKVPDFQIDSITQKKVIKAYKTR